jgi:exodeoxyribonuclease V gamma subunit
MENLLALYIKIIQTSPLSSVFSQETVLVHNKGMQHWLNMSLAQQQGIAMNTEYSLPSQFFWHTIRALLGETVIEQAPYSREVLVWRIDAILASDIVISSALYTPVTQYWRQQKADPLKRFQLAKQIADLFEQYLVFRPDWLSIWQQGEQATEQLASQLTLSPAQQQSFAWQAAIWRQLVADIAYDPQALVQQAIEQLPLNHHVLPERIAVFGINSLPPIWLNFLSAISDYCQVHFFHLNPCVEYWGDILSTKQAAKQLSRWLTEENLLVGNPLLANWGAQGREFLSLLQQVSTINIEAFETVDNTEPSVFTSVEEQPLQQTVLAAVQQDILTLTDRRQAPINLHDSSITIVSAHNELREIQALHDHLLHLFNADASLTPKDVLVMCPQVERYAPYIDAVFSQSWQQLDSHLPPLPCSIADRISRDCEPLVAAFLQLLQLPDSRFQVTELVGYFRLSALMKKFDLTAEQLTTIEQWLVNSAIHWGLTPEHKQQLIACETPVSKQFTWQQGLTRLLLGFAYDEENSLFDDYLLLGDVEGEHSILLGKLCLLLEQLQAFCIELQQAKTAEDWQQVLLSMLQQLFVPVEREEALLLQGINSLVDHCIAANYEQLITLEVVREYLSQHFSEPETGQQFLVGQVTFCSLLPMRSIPFKVIAILGLNDCDFPRHRQPLAFDLIANTPARVGDRSRRGDDRYLFLEALISARQQLYLSYQGRQIKNNNPRQPSLVLQELMNYLQQGYGWSFNGDESSAVKQLPLQPFSLRNYQGELPSFDQHWLQLAQKSITAFEPLRLQQPDETTTAFSLVQWLQFLRHAPKYLAKTRLNLNFDEYDQPLSDNEPFLVDNLAVYQLRMQLMELAMQPLEDKKTAVETFYQQAKLSGKFPELPTMDQQWQLWQQEHEQFEQVAERYALAAISEQRLVLQLNVDENTPITITTQLTLVDDIALIYRPTMAKYADDMLMVLLAHSIKAQQLVLQHQSHRNKQQQQLLHINAVEGVYFNAKNQKMVVKRLPLAQITTNFLTTVYQWYQQGLQQPLPIVAALIEDYAEKLHKAKPKQSVPPVGQWQLDNCFNSLIQASDHADLYLRYLFPNGISFEEFEPYAKAILAEINLIEEVKT